MDEFEMHRNSMVDKSDDELIAIEAQFLPPHSMHLAAKQLLRQRALKRETADFGKLYSQANKTLHWTRAGVIIAAIALVAAAIAAAEGWRW